MNRLLQLAPLLLLLSACSPSSPDPVFNHFRCLGAAEPHQDYLLALSDGTEDSLTVFYERLNEHLGKPRVFFLHYTLDNWDEFFHPEKRQIDPKILASPMGVQKIMIWDSVAGFWDEHPASISLQVEQKRAGYRTIDKWYCSLELRIQEVSGESVDWSTAKGEEVKQQFQEWLVESVGLPRDPQPDTAWARLSDRYDEQEKMWQARVRPWLSGECYPPVALKDGSGEMRLQVCEARDLQDTLVCRVAILDSAGHDIKAVLVNNATDSVVTRLLIYDGYLGYSIFTRDPSLVAEIRFVLPQGRQILFYERGDFTRDLMPFQFRPPEKEKPDRPGHEATENTIRTL